MQESVYVGLDLGSSHCCQSVIETDGRLRFSRFIRTSEQHLREAFTGLGGEVRVHMEAGELADWAGSVIGPRCYEQSLENTKNTVHTRYATQRKIPNAIRRRLTFSPIAASIFFLTCGRHVELCA